MRKYIIIILALSCINVYANDIEAELGENAHVNTKTMKAARYFCHAFFVLVAQHPDVLKQKVEHLHHKIAALSAHCAKGNFHQAFTESGLADAVNLDHHHALSNAHLLSDTLGLIAPVNRPGYNGGGIRKFNMWEHQAIATHALLDSVTFNKRIIE
jgi:hypothetical protein